MVRSPTSGGDVTRGFRGNLTAGVGLTYIHTHQVTEDEHVSAARSNSHELSVYIYIKHTLVDVAVHASNSGCTADACVSLCGPMWVLHRRSE